MQIDVLSGSGKGSVYLEIDDSQFESIDGKLHLKTSILNPFPVGSFYIQAPVAESNDELTAFPLVNRPASLFGGTWSAEFEGEEGIFFRTKGTLSDLAGSRVDGKQKDQTQGHLHMQQAQNYSGRFLDAGGNGALGYSTSTSSPITDGVNGTPRTGAETRSINRQIKVWRRTA